MKPGVRSVFAVVSHFGRSAAANAWLEQCVQALRAQSRRPDAIIVVDDCSPVSPQPVLERFDDVSLLRTRCNGGPFAILERIFANAPCDAVLLQDSDDWSMPSRLATLLHGIDQWQADAVGSQVQTLFEDIEPVPALASLRFPEDPLPALLDQPTSGVMLLPSALVRCALVRRLGGLSAGLRFGADSEFVRRAVMAATTRNLPEVLYVRRMHSRSLTRDPATGMGSAPRREVQALVQDHARRLVAAHHRGEPLDLTPVRPGRGAELTHVCGPRLAWAVDAIGTAGVRATDPPGASGDEPV